MSIIKKKLIVILLIVIVLIGLGNAYVLLKNRNELNNKEVIVVQDQLESDTKKRIKLSNINQIYDVIKDQKSCSAIIIKIDDSIQYINIILDDVPKADNVEEYYNANKEAINNIFALTSESEFSDFYEKIVHLRKLDHYEILTNTIENTGINYNLDIKLNGEKDSTIPITICVTDASKLESSTYWDKR